MAFMIFHGTFPDLWDNVVYIYIYVMRHIIIRGCHAEFDQQDCWDHQIMSMGYNRENGDITQQQ